MTPVASRKTAFNQSMRCIDAGGKRRPPVEDFFKDQGENERGDSWAWAVWAQQGGWHCHPCWAIDDSLIHLLRIGRVARFMVGKMHQLLMEFTYPPNHLQSSS